MSNAGTIWAFDLGKGSIGEAVRQGSKFLHKASLLIPADFAGKNGGLRLAPAPVQELRIRSRFGLVADRLKKSGAAKAPFGSHRPALRRKRLGSSQPIVAARLVLIRDFCTADH